MVEVELGRGLCPTRQGVEYGFQANRNEAHEAVGLLRWSIL